MLLIPQATHAVSHAMLAFTKATLYVAYTTLEVAEHTMLELPEPCCSSSVQRSKYLQTWLSSSKDFSMLLSSHVRSLGDNFKKKLSSTQGSFENDKILPICLFFNMKICYFLQDFFKSNIMFFNWDGTMELMGKTNLIFFRHLLTLASSEVCQLFA